MADCEHREQRELVAVNALDELIAFCNDVDRRRCVVMDLNWEEPLERAHHSFVPGVDDEAGAACGELGRLIRLDERVANLRKPLR